MTRQQKINYCNKQIGIPVKVDSPQPFKGITASAVHPDTNVIGIDLLDGFPIPYLAHIDNVSLQIDKGGSDE